MPRARRTDNAAAVRIPAGLTGPIDLELTKLVDQIPGPKALAGGTTYQPKLDGYRLAIVRAGDTARLWSRNGKELTEQFPDIAAAAVRQLPEGVVLDGEVVVTVKNGRTSFDAIQRRGRASGANALRMAATRPATYVAFDLLAIGGVDLRPLRWSVRRARLEKLAEHWRAPMGACPTTKDVDEARLWFEVLPETNGTEGLVCKGDASRYVGGRRTDWWKVNSHGVRRVRSPVLRVLWLVTMLSRVRSACATGVADGWRRDGGTRGWAVSARCRSARLALASGGS